jgi:hypothetical protein
MDFSGGCTRCYAEVDLALLSGDPAAVPDELAVTALEEVHDHWTPEQWRYLCRAFLPRLPALLRSGEHDEGRLLRSFSRWQADLAGWPADEREDVETLLADELREALATRRAHDLVRVLDGLACVYDDIRPWLARLDARDGAAAEAGIVRLAASWAFDLLWEENRWFTWWYCEDETTLVREWTLSAKPTVVAFAARHPECKTAQDAVLAYDHLARGDQSPWYYPGRAGLRLV